MMTSPGHSTATLPAEARPRPDQPAGTDEAARPAGNPALEAIALFPAPDSRTRILLVEDDPQIASELGEYLETAGFIVYLSNHCENAAGLAGRYRFDIVILDLAGAVQDGTALLGQLSAAHPDMPIIIISSDDSLHDKIAMLATGADDYIARPVHRAELLARVHAILRRQRTLTPKQVRIGPLTVDFESRRAFVQGRDVRLTGKEYNCLELLTTRAGMTITKEMFLQHLYSGRDEPEMKIIDVFVCKVRRKLRDAGADGIIETVWGRGYVIHPRD